MTNTEIQAKVSSLLTETRSGNEFPLPLEQIVKYLGFECHFYIPDKDIADIASAVSHLKRKIYVNQNNLIELQRFSIACRIGNLALHGSNRDYIDQIDSARDPQAKEAEFFAETLLMPEPAFSAQWHKTQGNVATLSAYFGVSPLKISRRAAGLHLLKTKL